jgi:hypothetical protein
MAAVREGKLQPARVPAICQDKGAPNLMELAKMPHLVEAVSGAVDLVLLGLA